MNPLNPSTLAGVALAARLFGRPTAVRALTLSQATIRGIPGRANKDVAEIQRQSEQAAEQAVQLAESVFTADWSDPDLLAAHPDAQTLAEGLRASATATWRVEDAWRTNRRNRSARRSPSKLQTPLAPPGERGRR